MGLSQFELSKLVLRNLNNYKLSPTTKLVLLALVDRLPNIFPSQKTLSDQLGISIASVKRAIAELRNQKIIITSNNDKFKTLDYKFTGTFYAQNKLIPPSAQKELQTGINLSDKEKKEETKKEYFFSLNKSSSKTGIKSKINKAWYSKNNDYKKRKYESNSHITGTNTPNTMEKQPPRTNKSPYTDKETAIQYIIEMQAYYDKPIIKKQVDKVAQLWNIEI